MPDSEQSIPEDFSRRFRERGLRMTRPRQVILEVLDGYGGFASAEEIYLQVHSDYPGIGLATVYRTLILLSEMGFISKIDPGDGKARYELRTPETEIPHQHLLICSSCFRVVRYSDFSDQERETLHAIERRLEGLHDFAIDRHEVHYYGRCRDCRAADPDVTKD